MKRAPKVGFLGCGNMGTAVLKRWLTCDAIQSACIIKPTQPSSELQIDNKVSHIQPDTVSSHLDIDILVLGIKPQIFKEAASAIAPYIGSDTVIVSLMAGLPITALETVFETQPIMRTMPNMAVAYGQGVTGVFSKCDKETLLQAHALLEHLGMVVQLDSEAQINAITAASGSGLAYVFYFAEAMAKGIEDLGFEKEHATQIAMQTIIGASHVMTVENAQTPDILRQNVTSKAGTTEAALTKLMDGRMQQSVIDAMHEALKRAAELSTLIQK